GVAPFGAFTLPISPVISMTSGALGEAGGPMRTIRAYRSIPLALAAVVGLFTVASAQQSPPAKQAKPATKSETKSEAKSPPPAKQAKQPTPGPAGGAQPTLLGQFGDWGAYTATNGGKKLCYALAKPSSQATEPSNRPRDPAYIFVSTRPSENVRNELSIVIGYPFKPGYEASVDIGSAKYAMYTQAD